MKRCVCYDSHDYREKRILVKAHSYFAQGKVWSNVYCIRCGNQTYMDDTALCIDIEELNVPLDAIMEEFKIVNNILNSREMFPNVLVIFNIMKAIIWAYEVDYYEKFDNYVFEDVRDGIIDFFTKNETSLTEEFLANESNYISYLNHLENYFKSHNCKTFNLQSALTNPIIFTSTNHAHFGPASLVSNEYTDTLGHVRKSNNYYYPKDKYFRLNSSKLKEEATNIHNFILEKLKKYISLKCDNLTTEHVKTLYELKGFVLTNNHDGNQIFLTGLWIVFSEIIENGDKYLNLSSRTYIEYLAKLHQFKAYTNKLIKDN